MDLRLKTLSHLDPLAVPLPHGTEVLTRVERFLGERVIPRGAVGRVVAIDGDRVEVSIVGVGTAAYARTEVAPRRSGQLAYAHRRAAAWDALSSCIVLETTVGSRAWGLAETGSDIDRRGAFAVPLSWSVGLVSPPEELISVDGSATYWNLGKLVRQALRADPNTLETLFVDSAQAKDDMGVWLLAARKCFVSVEIYASFGRYALSQLKRLEQSLRLFEHRTSVLEWLRKEPTLSLDQVAGKLSRITTESPQAASEALHRARQYVKDLYRSLYDQGLLQSSDFSALSRFAQEPYEDLELPRELRPKNAYNLLRLIWTASLWLREGEPIFTVPEPLRSELLSIKHGEVPLAEVLARAEAMTPELESARQNSRLPARPDAKTADALLRRIGEELARRFASAAPGPFGQDAPSPPEVDFEEPAP
jgi:hypothetical protein